MAKRSPDQVADKLIRNLSNATEEVRAGVEAVDKSPTEMAAQRLDIAARNFQAAVQSGKMARRLRAVSLDDWKAKTVAKIGRIPEGIEASRDKLVKFHGQLQSHQSQIDRELQQIGPAKTLDDSIRRMTVQVRGMSAFEFDPTKS